MQHSFNVEIAQRYGVEEAILIENIYYWVEKNKANEKHFHHGRYWTYNSVRAFKQQFPYMTERTLARKLQKLIDEGLIMTENFNENKYDRTLWYSLTDYAYSIMPKCQMETSKMSNGNDKNGEPIPYIKPNKKPNNIFIPPTLEEVKEYAKSKQRLDLAEKFYEYYTADENKLWCDKDGKKMKSWKQKFLTWCNHSSFNQVKDKNFKGRQYENKEINSLYTNLDDIVVRGIYEKN